MLMTMTRDQRKAEVERIGLRIMSLEREAAKMPTASQGWRDRMIEIDNMVADRNRLEDFDAE